MRVWHHGVSVSKWELRLKKKKKKLNINLYQIQNNIFEFVIFFNRVCICIYGYRLVAINIRKHVLPNTQTLNTDYEMNTIYLI